ncbi:hypothetical protein GCM10022380_52240 [Amycolatopsis tucumanensis]|uniref:Uncharacterized protein n=1 Tax=Amycolatopsis tucumanensis TaxID=401106 RepID=A0ABP7IV80_9PSEU
MVTADSAGAAALSVAGCGGGDVESAAPAPQPVPSSSYRPHEDNGPGAHLEAAPARVLVRDGVVGRWVETRLTDSADRRHPARRGDGDQVDLAVTSSGTPANPASREEST